MAYRPSPGNEPAARQRKSAGQQSTPGSLSFLLVHHHVPHVITAAIHISDRSVPGRPNDDRKREIYLLCLSNMLLINAFKQTMAPPKVSQCSGRNCLRISASKIAASFGLYLAINAIAAL